MKRSERLQLIVEAVLYCQKVSRLGMPKSCYAKALREPIFFLWELRNAKSKQAAARYRSNETEGLAIGKGELIFDHAIPFKYLQHELINLDSVTTETVESVLSKHCVGCLISKDENSRLNKSGLGQKMPDDWDGKNVLARYDKAEIKVEFNHEYKGEPFADDDATR